MHTIPMGKSNLSTDDLAFWSKVKSLDLGAIAYKLMYPDEGFGWSKEQTTKAIARYKMFLLLVYLYPDSKIVPTKEIDRVWHQHILDTFKYNHDCQFLFGRFLHHFPYGGITQPGEEAQQKICFDQVQQLLKPYFDLSISEHQPMDMSGCDIINPHLLELSGCNIMTEPSSVTSSEGTTNYLQEPLRPKVALDWDPLVNLYI